MSLAEPHAPAGPGSPKQDLVLLSSLKRGHEPSEVCAGYSDGDGSLTRATIDRANCGTSTSSASRLAQLSFLVLLGLLASGKGPEARSRHEKLSRSGFMENFAMCLRPAEKSLVAAVNYRSCARSNAVST